MPAAGPNDALKILKPRSTATATQNACKLCAPLGAALVFKGIAGCVPLLHGSQGCATYIRRYLISHFKEPVDIACSNFSEQTAIFGGGGNLKTALTNIRRQYAPQMIGVATTCLSETIGDDVALLVKAYLQAERSNDMPAIVTVATPSYRGTHMQGFHAAVKAGTAALAERRAATHGPTVNLFPGLVSPADLRHFKEIVSDFALSAMLLPDYSQTLDGGLWNDYQRIPPGGTTLEALSAAGGAMASLELGRVLAGEPETAATMLERRFQVPARRLGLPMGVGQSDLFFHCLAEISGRPLPPKYAEERSRLLDALVDGHKYVNGLKAVIYGEEDLVAGLSAFLSEIGILPVVCASGGRSGRLAQAVEAHIPARRRAEVQVLDGADFVEIEAAAQNARPDLIIGHSKGYGMARRLGLPLVRVGFPIHDRLSGARQLNVGYRGAMALFDRILDALLTARQDHSAAGYPYL